MAGWLDSAVGALQSGYVPGADSAFPPYVPQPSQEQQSDDIWAQIAAEEAAANAAADRRNVGGMRRAPIRGEQPFSDLMAPGVAMALGNGPRPPVDPGAYATTVGYDGPNWGYIPPSLQAAKAMTAPQQPPMVPPMATTAPSPSVAPAPALPPPQDVGPAPVPTDVSSQSRTPPPVTARPAPMGMVAPAVAGPAQSWGDRLNEAGPMLMAMGAGLAGPHGFGEGLQNAFANAAPYGAALQKRRQDLALQNQQQNLTIAGLRAKGVPEADIASAIGNPEVLKALVNQYYGKDKFDVKQVGEDKYGQKTFRVFNSADGTFKEIPASNADEAKTTAATDDAQNLTGTARLEALKASDPDYARQVQAVVDGNETFPTGRQANTPAGRRLIQDALAVSGSLSEGDFKNKQAVRKRYTSGKDFDITKSINTVVDHGKDLVKAIEDLHNYSILPGFLNPVTGKVSEQFNPQYQAALGRFKQNADTFARDYDYAVSGGRPTVSGRQSQRELYDEYGSTEKNMGALQKSMELLRDRLREHTRGYEAGMMPHEPPGLVPSLNPEARDFIESMATTGRAPPGSAAGTPARGGGTVAPGAYVWDPQRGLVPK